MTSLRSDASDPATEAAVATVLVQLAVRGDADDDETFARNLVLALRVRGWRPPVAPQGMSRRRRGAPPNAEYLAAKEAAFGKRPGSDAS